MKIRTLATALTLGGIIAVGGVATSPAAASTLYEHANYKGKTYAAVNAPTIKNGLDRKASSIRNHGKATTIFKSTGYRGDSWTIKYDYNKLNYRWNDKIRSFKRL